MKVVNYGKGSLVFSEGDQGDSAYLVQSGKLEVSREVDGKRSVLGEIGPGKMFGEMALISDAPRMATVSAVEDSLLIAVPPEVFEAQLNDMEAMTKALLLSMIGHVRSLTTKVEALEKQLGAMPDPEPEVVFYKPAGFNKYKQEG